MIGYCDYYDYWFVEWRFIVILKLNGVEDDICGKKENVGKFERL